MRLCYDWWIVSTYHIYLKNIQRSNMVAPEYTQWFGECNETYLS